MTHDNGAVQVCPLDSTILSASTPMLCRLLTTKGQRHGLAPSSEDRGSMNRTWYLEDGSAHARGPATPSQR